MAEISKHDRYPVITFKNSSSYETWLKKNHAICDGVWLKIAKGQSGIKSISYMEAIDVALCHGWIDGLRRSLDNDYFIQKFTPRRANSAWSAINRQKVAALIKEGKMHASGQAAIDSAKKDGRWESV